MIERLKGKENAVKFALLLVALFGVYLIVAWASYSPLDNGWSVASSVSHNVLNKTGEMGAWLIDLLFAMFGRVAFLVGVVFACVPVYVIVSRLYESLSCKQAVIWLVSFVLLMVGLAGLANVLLSNSATYLSGGFIGAMLADSIGGVFGLFGTLFCSMILTAIGFYLCSGQIILQLFNRLYGWILEEKMEKAVQPQAKDNNPPHILQAENTPQQAVISVENPANDTDPDNQIITQNQVESPQFTDVSMFPRPNITGLKTESVASDSALTPTAPVDTSTFPKMTDVSRFQVNNERALPKVSVPEMSAENTANTMVAPLTAPLSEAVTPLSPFSQANGGERIAPTAVTQTSLVQAPVAQENIEAVALPTIRLNPEQHLPTEQAKMGQLNAEHENVQQGKVGQANIEPKNSEQAPIVQTKSLTPSLDPNILQPVEPLAEPALTMPTVSIENAPTFVKQGNHFAIPEPIATEAMSDSADEMVEGATQAVSSSPEMATTAYPKGYGDSLIHPLLARKKPLEKPTTPLPTLDLLTESPPEAQQITEQEIRETSARIEQELANFGVKATVEDVLVGPVVTRYEIKPAAGVKASKITNLDSDLARALIFKAIRITDVVPGKPFMGIETPNRHRQTVWLRDVLERPEFRESSAILPMALGKDISGEPVIIDMAKMPHLLVAGQTGGGKSVGVNTMILSLLFKLTPEQVRFIMIDPKVVELSIYNDIPHLLTPVVTDMKKAENALRWAVEEMERRYLLVSSLGVRSIEGYNRKIQQAEEMSMPIPNPLWRPGDTMDALPPPLKKMSYIVLIVDEFADLMMSVGKQVEDHIMRIAQKARAVGIHLILATQRPSTDVITGVIKANIPSRIAFTVASQIDSRTILDKGGAESLLGRGDMLYSGAGSPEIIRIHGAFMTDDDVQRVADNWKARGKPEYIDSIIESVDDPDGSERGGGNDLDPLFDEITQYVIESNVTSISGIQRRFSIGFNRAARIIDQLEDQRILSAPDNRGKREVLAR